MPARFRRNRLQPRGVSNRNAALRWIHENASANGVFYFADDDNTYDLKLFQEVGRYPDQTFHN